MKSLLYFRSEELVLAKFDGDYYRAIVLGREMATYSVLYLDYGNINDVKVEEMIRFPRFLLDMEVFPVVCFVESKNLRS